MREFGEGEVLVADMTDPDWEPIMKRATAIVTNRGADLPRGHHRPRTGIPAGRNRERHGALADGLEVTVSCAEGETGTIYEGLPEFNVEETAGVTQMPESTWARS